MAKVVRLKRWNGKKCIAKVQSQEAQRLTKAAMHLVNKIKQQIGTKGSKCGKNGPRSSPGAFPNLQCGQLRNSITHEVKGLKARVGTSLKHGKFLELGTKNMSARPFLRPTLKAERSKLKKILIGKKLKGF